MKVAVLGAGGMGATVIEHLLECEDVSEIIAQDVRPERVAELKTKYNIEATSELDVVRRVKAGLPPSTPARDAYETTRLSFATETSADEKHAVRLDEIGA